MPQAITIAIARFRGFVYENLTDRFIRFVLEQFALVSSPAEQVIGDQPLARAGPVHDHSGRLVK
jgi:hypothetical protein